MRCIAWQRRRSSHGAGGRGLSLTGQKSRDTALNNYVHYLFVNGDGIFAARSSVYGIAHTMGLNLRDPHELPRSKAALVGYAAEAPDAQRDPLPWEATLCIAAFLVAE